MSMQSTIKELVRPDRLEYVIRENKRIQEQVKRLSKESAYKARRD